MIYVGENKKKPGHFVVKADNQSNIYKIYIKYNVHSIFVCHYVP